jgi:hypothetical protein
MDFRARVSIGVSRLDQPVPFARSFVVFMIEHKLNANRYASIKLRQFRCSLF